MDALFSTLIPNATDPQNYPPPLFTSMLPHPTLYTIPGAVLATLATEWQQPDERYALYPSGPASGNNAQMNVAPFGAPTRYHRLGRLNHPAGTATKSASTQRRTAVQSSS